MKEFKMVLTTIDRNTGEEKKIQQRWYGEDIDEASENARQNYELWFEETKLLQNLDYRLGEFVEVKELENE